MINSIPVIPTPTPIVMDPGQVIRPMTTPMVIPGGGAGARIRSTTGGVAPVRGPSQDYVNRRTRRETLADKELARRQYLEDQARIRQQAIEDAEWERKAEIMDYETDRAWDLAKEDRDLNRELDKEGRMRSEKIREEKARVDAEIEKEKRAEEYKIAGEKRASDEAKEKADLEWKRGEPERKLRERQINAQIELSKKQLEEVTQRMADNKKKYDLEVEKAYFEFRSGAKSVRSGAKLKERITSFIDDLPNKKQAIHDKARADAMVHVLALVKMGDNIDEASEDFLEDIYNEFDVYDFSEITDEAQKQKFLDKVLTKAQSEELALGGYVKSIKDTLERAVLEQNNLIRQHEIYLNMLPRISDKEIDEEAFAVLDKEFKKILGLNNKSISSVNAKGGLDSEGNPTTPPADANLIAPDLKTPASSAEPTEEETKGFIDDLTNKDPGKEVIADPEGISDPEGESDPVGDEVKQADSFLDPKTGDDDLEEEEFSPRSITLNAVDLAGKGMDVLGRMADIEIPIGDAAKYAGEFLGNNAEIIAPTVVAARNPLGEGMKKAYRGLESVVEKTGDAVIDSVKNSAPVKALTAPDPSIGDIDDVVPDVDPNKPVTQRWKLPDGTDAGPKASGASPVKTTNLMAAESVDRANQLLESKGLKPYDEPMPDRHPNQKVDLKQRAEWQLRFRDHVNKQVQSGRTTLKTRLVNALKAMKPGMPQGKLGKFLKVLGPAAAAYEVIALSKDVYELINREDPEAAQAVKDHIEVEEAGLVAEEGMASIKEEVQNSMGTSEEVYMPIEEMNNSADFSSGKAGTYNLPPNLAEAIRMSNE